MGFTDLSAVGTYIIYNLFLFKPVFTGNGAEHGVDVDGLVHGQEAIWLVMQESVQRLHDGRVGGHRG